MSDTKKYEQRMYGLVMYNLSGIQKGIQFAHAVVEYQKTYGETQEYKQWAAQDKTVVVLNGGTSNEGRYAYDKEGTMEQHYNILEERDVAFEEFIEPDLNCAMAAIAFLADERVFDHEKHPSFLSYLLNKHKGVGKGTKILEAHSDDKKELSILYANDYEQWIQDVVGNKQNAFLKEFLPSFKLA